MKTTKIIAALAITGSFLINSAYADNLDTKQTQQIQDIVKNYITQNPEVIIQSLQSYQQQQMNQSIEKTQNKSLAAADSLLRSTTDPVAGNPKGKISIVEFFDYQCGHCISMQSVLQNLLKYNANIRLIFKEFPIRGPVSEMASKAALAAQKQDKYMQFHDALMQTAGKAPLTEAIIYKTATDTGLDLAKLKEDMNSQEVSNAIKANFSLAQSLELMGTPAIFIAKSDTNSKSPASAIVFIPGETDADHLNKIVDQMNK